MYRGSDVSKFPGFNDEDSYVFNFRDPRDIWCNQYYWLTQHDAPNEKVKSDRLARFNKGIDHSVTKSYRSFIGGGDNFYQLISRVISGAEAAPRNSLFVSYAQLCLKYDVMINRLNSFFDVDFDRVTNAVINAESPGGLEKNNNWIGSNWKGCDVAPGRYKSELSRETIDMLNAGLKEHLKLLASADLSELDQLYSE